MFSKEKKENRFIIKEKQRFNDIVLHIIVDTNTGVNYLMPVGLKGNGITPVLDSDGKLVVDK